MPPKTLLVTGAAGFIGSHSVDELLAHGYAVVGVDNLRTGHRCNLAAALQQERFTFYEADVTDVDAMTEIFTSHRLAGVLHLAALVSVPESFAEPALNFQLNLQASELIARLCHQYQCRRMVFASSAAVYGNEATLPCHEDAIPDPQSPYAAAKLASEWLLQGYAASYGLEVVRLRYFNIYGPRQDPGSPYSGVLSIFQRCFTERSAVTLFGDGQQSRDFVFVTDVARINHRALVQEKVDCPGAINVCTQTPNSLNQILVQFEAVTGYVPEYRYEESRIGDIRHSLGNQARLHAVLGIVPETPLSVGVDFLLGN